MAGLADARLNWWQSLLRPGGIARGDISGGVIAAIVLIAIDGSYGLLAFAPLGAEQAQNGFLLGAISAAVATIVSLLAGGRGPLLSGPNAALVILLAGLLGSLASDPGFVGVDGVPNFQLIIAFAGLGLLLGGVMQAVLSALKLGGLVRYVPYPVHAGYVNGTAVLMIAAMIPLLLGLPLGRTADWQLTQPLAPIIGVATLWIAIRPPAWTRRVPAFLAAMILGTVLHHLLALTPLSAYLGPLFEAPEFQWPGLDTIAPVQNHLHDGLLTGKLLLLLEFAAAVAMMSSLQTALAGSTVDEITRKRRNGERELFAQGIANIAVGFLGSVPSAGSSSRGVLNLEAGGSTSVSRLVFGVTMLLILIVGLRFLSLVPVTVIAGVFVATAVAMFDEWTRRATAVMFRQALRWRVPRLLGVNYAVMALVAGVTVFISLPLAIALGTLTAILMFIRSNVKEPIRRVVHADRRTSRKIRPFAEAQLLRDHGKKIAVIELDGALFFGTAEHADEEIEKLAHESDLIIIDFERVIEVDASGARVLLHALHEVTHAGKHFLLAGLLPRDPRTRTLRDMDVHGRLDHAHFFPDVDHALEFAEEHLLQSLDPASADDGPLRLDETLFGAGLDAGEAEVLAAMMTERRIAKGQAVFRRGDPSDALFVLLKGQIGIRIPASRDDARGRRLVSYAPGVSFGELGLLQNRERSADAIAETDALVLELSREKYETLVREHPVLHGKLLLNVSLLLSSRVRALTDELQAAEDAA